MQKRKKRKLTDYSDIKSCRNTPKLSQFHEAAMACGWFSWGGGNKGEGGAGFNGQET